MAKIVDPGTIEYTLQIPNPLNHIILNITINDWDAKSKLYQSLHRAHAKANRRYNVEHKDDDQLAYYGVDWARNNQ